MHIRISQRLLSVLPGLLTLLPLMNRPDAAVAQSSVIYDVPNDTTQFLPCCYDFMPDERYLLLAGAGGRGQTRAELRVWDFETGQFILENRLDYEGLIVTIDVAPDGETLLVATQRHDQSLENDDVWLWKMQAWPQREGSPQLRSTVEPIRRLQTANAHGDPANIDSYIGGQTVLSNDASRVAVRRSDENPPPRYQVESIVILNTSGRVTETWELPDAITHGWRGGMQFSPSGAQLATTRCRGHYERPPVRDDDSERTTISIDLATWDVESGELVESRTLVNQEPRLNSYLHGSWYDSLDYSSDGSLIACDGPEFAVEIVNAETLETIRSLVGLTSCVQSVAFSSDNTLVAAISNDDGNLCLWQTGTGELLFRNENPAINSEMRLLRFSPDDSKIVTRGSYRGDDNTHTEIRVWDVEQMRQ